MTLEEDLPIRGRYRNVKTVDLYQMDDTGWSALYRPLPEEASTNTAELNVQTSHVEFSPIPLNEVQRSTEHIEAADNKPITLALSGCARSARAGRTPAIKIVGPIPENHPTLYRHKASTVAENVGFGLRYQSPGGGLGVKQEESWQFRQSYRVKYSKNRSSIGIGIDLAAYRYSTQHYYSFSDVNSITGYSLNEYQVPWALDRRQNTWQVSLSQTLGRWGSLYTSGTHNDYWSGRTDNNLSLGYNVMLMGISYNLSYSIFHIKGDGHWPENRQVSFNMQVPLSLFGS